jgi:hypothetical protein
MSGGGPPVSRGAQGPSAAAPTPQGPLELALAAAAGGGRIGCATVFRVAAAQGVPAAEAGRAVQRLGIKITGCQLGCFR